MARASIGEDSEMDIVRRAYNRVADETAYYQDTWELKRMVRAEGYPSH